MEAKGKFQRRDEIAPPPQSVNVITVPATSSRPGGF